MKEYTIKNWEIGNIQYSQRIILKNGNPFLNEWIMVNDNDESEITIPITHAQAWELLSPSVARHRWTFRNDIYTTFLKSVFEI